MLVIGIALVITVLGMAGLTASRVQSRIISAGCDWEEAGTLAFAATEHAQSYINAAAKASPSTWRSAYISRAIAFTQPMGRGTFSWALKDETDGNLSADYLRPIRIYGIGKVGVTTRVYSVQVIPGGSPLDVLRTAIHSGSSVTLNGIINAVNGPISSNATIYLNDTVNGALEAPTVNGSASGNYSQTTPAPVKTMPSSTVYAQYLANATSISWSSMLSSGPPVLLTAANNPYGAADPNGLYSIVLPDGAAATIQNARICGTLLISASNATITFGPMLWEPARPDYPILIINATNTTINFEGSTTWLREADINMNLNPPGTPFEGLSDTDQNDDFPPQYRGLIHIIGSSNTINLSSNAYIAGTLIADGPIATTVRATLIQNPAIRANPPLGYSMGDKLTIVPSSWRWDTLP